MTDQCTTQLESTRKFLLQATFTLEVKYQSKALIEDVMTKLQLLSYKHATQMSVLVDDQNIVFKKCRKDLENLCDQTTILCTTMHQLKDEVKNLISAFERDQQRTHEADQPDNINLTQAAHKGSPQDLDQLFHLQEDIKKEKQDLFALKKEVEEIIQSHRTGTSIHQQRSHPSSQSAVNDTKQSIPMHPSPMGLEKEDPVYSWR